MNLFFRVIGVLVLVSFMGCSNDGDGLDLSSSSNWEDPVVLSGNQDAYGGRAVMDAAGNALVAWRSGSRLYAKRYTVAGGWDADATQFDNSVLRASGFGIAANADGQGVAAWRVEETTGDFFYARQFDLTSGWDPDIQRLCNNNYDGQVPQAAVDPDGNIMTVFSKYTANDVYARYYESGTGWDAAPTVIDSGSYNSNYPKIAMDDNGNAMAVWEQWDGSYTNAHARYYSATSGWDGTVTLLDDPAVNTNVQEVYVALDKSGSGVAFWRQEDGALYEVYARTFTTSPTFTWDSVIFPVTSTTANAHAVRGAIAPDGTIIITWIVMDGTKYQLYSRSYSPADGWDASAALVNDGSLDLHVEAAYVAFDESGNGLAVWSQDRETEPTVYARAYNTGTGWDSEIETVYEYPDGYGGLVTSLSLTPDGKAMIVIEYSDVPDYDAYQVMAIFSK